jgi:HlyD family secretion protein
MKNQHSTTAVTPAWYYLLRTPQSPHDVIEVSGRVEGDDSAVASKAAGRVREVTVREGDAVKAGQVIAGPDDDQLKAREEQAQSAVTQAEGRVAYAAPFDVAAQRGGDFVE